MPFSWSPMNIRLSSSANRLTGRLGEASPETSARLTRVVYLLFFATAVLGSVVAPGISGPGATGDAAATANNIVTHQSSFRLGWALDLTSTALYVALMALFYQLFKPVSRTSPYSPRSSAWSDVRSRLSAVCFNSPHSWSWGAAHT